MEYQQSGRRDPFEQRRNFIAIANDLHAEPGGSKQIRQLCSAGLNRFGNDDPFSAHS
jgi:hypothetical protein